MKRTGIHLESPLSCLALLATLAAVSIFISIRSTCRIRASGPFPPRRARDLAGGCIVMLLFSCSASARRHWGYGGAPPIAIRCPGRAGCAGESFLALKIALVQPIMLCGFVLELLMGPLGGFAGLGFRRGSDPRLALGDHGSAAALPGVPSLAHQPGSHRHSVADVPGMVWRRVDVLARTRAAAYFGDVVQLFRRPQWLRLDDSWSGLFHGAAIMTLELRNVSKRFSGIPAVDNVSFPARAGEITGYLGPNGSGKSTTMKMITGLLDATSGLILFDGEPHRKRLDGI